MVKLFFRLKIVFGFRLDICYLCLFVSHGCLTNGWDGLKYTHDMIYVMLCARVEVLSSLLNPNYINISV
ncbi:hypothetical protein L1887_39111 [Cichorium endivia]|nr:hypothetical protein L1887_39111 [Cichorium endivia]